ncbi:transcription-repair coupling factor [Lachnospiraceae bacterium KM106-2]|nr:transcription-repair coupling factor [Lachnospiraceae bacterium KM106-2]
MNTFLEPLKELNEYSEVVQDLRLNNTPIQITGCINSQKCHLMYGLAGSAVFKLIVTYNDLNAKEIYEDYKLYDKDVYFYPAKDVIFYSADIHGNAIVRDRLKILKRIIEQKPTTIITTIDAGMDQILPLEFIRQRVISIRAEQTLDLEWLKAEMIYLGYERCAQVETPGQFAIRGGIIDIFPLTEEVPYRVELWDEEVDTIRSFDVESQRSIEQIEELLIYPAAEIILDKAVLEKGKRAIAKESEEYIAALKEEKKREEAKRIKDISNEFLENLDYYNGSIAMDSYIKYFYKNTVSFFDYFTAENSIVFIDEPGRIEEKAEAVQTEFRESMIGRIEKGYILPSQVDVLFVYQELMVKLSNGKAVSISTMDYRIDSFHPKAKYDFTVKSISPYNHNFEMLVKDLKKWKENGYRIVLLSSSTSRATRLSEDLREHGLSAFFSDDFNRVVNPGEILVSYGALHKGFEYPMIKFAMISDSDIFGAEKKKRRKKKVYDGAKVHSFTDLNVGDYVVHENHGLGIYKGIEKIEVDKVAKDYIKIEYANSGVLYILATGLEVLQKYAGADARKPKLNKLNSVEWKNTKNRVRGAVKEIAQELVKLYAIRSEKKGYQFGPDTVWQREFEEMFPYEETDDQLRAIDDTKQDMESTKIMDRLICGDVGYGKTEIAIRAAFKAVEDGKQVVFLVPTTILAQQHYNNFVQRMKDFPVNIGMLSRFRTPAQSKKVVEQLKEGKCDILIGTHRVLSKDIEFKNLGLLIVDEEQRFGVTHKEKIKQLKSDVDVLTLSATPIPRTLHMSLVGIRDMSVLEEPPVDRLPIQTFVLEHNDEIIREAINRELARDGQVYYVYNRVSNIDEVANAIAELVPEANVAFAHGQMSERELEKIMFGFINGDIDVLVATTIIETGIDISNVNTMIIDDADRLGLSQLYQLRGRVGRSNRTSYAFLMYKRDKMLKEVAEKRLQAIKEFTELGSGFKIAMRDLEIRGAGNLLGARQHGHMEAVGYDLYCKMLNEAVKELKGESKEEDQFDTTVDVDIDAYIPATYIKSEFQKLDIYKRVAEIQNEEEFMDMQDELVDRFGDMPGCVNNLLNIAYLKSIAHNAYVTQLVQKDNRVRMAMYEKAMIDVSKLPGLLEKYGKTLNVEKGKNPTFVFEIPRKKNNKIDITTMFESVKQVLLDIQAIKLES